MDGRSGVVVDGWVCTRCGAANEDWRNFCRACPATKPPGTPGAGPAASGPPTAGATGSPAATRSEPRLPVWIALAVVAVIAAAGFAAYVLLRPESHDNTDHVAAGTPAAPAEIAPPDVTVTSVAPRTAGSILLVPDDLPPGWQSRGTAITGTDPSACFFDPGDTTNINGNALRVFVPADGSGLTVVSAGAVATTEAYASSVLARALDPSVIQCSRDHLEQTLAAANIRLDHLDVQAGSERGGADVRATYTLVGNGRSVKLFEEQFVFVSGNRIALLDVTSANEPFPERLRNQLITSAQTRLG